jgi:hypothetical protein
MVFHISVVALFKTMGMSIGFPRDFNAGQHDSKHQKHHHTHCPLICRFKISAEQKDVKERLTSCLFALMSRSLNTSTRMPAHRSAF